MDRSEETNNFAKREGERERERESNQGFGMNRQCTAQDLLWDTLKSFPFWITVTGSDDLKGFPVAFQRNSSVMLPVRDKHASWFYVRLTHRNISANNHWVQRSKVFIFFPGCCTAFDWQENGTMGAKRFNSETTNDIWAFGVMWNYLGVRNSFCPSPVHSPVSGASVSVKDPVSEKKKLFPAEN